MADNFNEDNMECGTIETDAAPVGHPLLDQIETPDEYITTCVAKIEKLSTEDEHTSNAATPPTCVGLHNFQSYTEQWPIINHDSEEWSIICQNEEGDTPLHRRIIFSETGAALRIIPNAKKRNGLKIVNSLAQTPLHLAVLTHQSEVVRHLVLSGSDVNVCDRHGNTALHLACRKDDHDENKQSRIMTVKALTAPIDGFEDQLDYSKLNYEGLSCLHLLAGDKPTDIELLAYLVQCGADINLKDGKSGRTILHLAAESHDVELTRFLISKPAVNLIATTWADQTAYHLAAGRGHHDIEELFEEAGAAKDETCEMDVSQ